ncbi:hypothetical protein CPB84DRAFT_1329549 [Gymnopilus junonius]|uniref:Uncharacterized protein n=1 Tax=Gymnopilus junonius TaxID=109634 RepID=A0A9P5N7P8_GYMJU|nr:hypothetical protein CPB84DRAFT_1329549 [Gymnopilus junonius]
MVSSLPALFLPIIRFLEAWDVRERQQREAMEKYWPYPNNRWWSWMRISEHYSIPFELADLLIYSHCFYAWDNEYFVEGYAVPIFVRQYNL